VHTPKIEVIARTSIRVGVRNARIAMNIICAPTPGHNLCQKVVRNLGLIKGVLVVNLALRVDEVPRVIL
jgi:hypothetical protein